MNEKKYWVSITLNFGDGNKPCVDIYEGKMTESETLAMIDRQHGHGSVWDDGEDSIHDLKKEDDFVQYVKYINEDDYLLTYVVLSKG